MLRLISLLLAALALNATAAPFAPANDDEVVEQLPTRLGSPAERRREREARAALQRAPTQLALALPLAREAIGRARQLGDPRELGQAQAALAPWWSLPDPPPEVRLLRATVKQSQHYFSAALADLDVLVQAPTRVPIAVQAQAELTRASVLQVLGRWAEASAGCERLAGPHYISLGNAVQLPAQVCLAELASLNGRASYAQQRLRQLAEATGENNPAWLSVVRAELAERLGDPTAQMLYREALQAARPDVYTLAAYADWLLARERYAEVTTLLAGREDADTLLLRLTIAHQRLGDPKAPSATATLAARFEAAALRGDSSHGREQARFALDLKGDPKAALRFAQANWSVQKEPADALMLLRAARAAGQVHASDPVLQLIRHTGWQDARLQAAPTAAEGTP